MDSFFTFFTPPKPPSEDDDDEEDEEEDDLVEKLELDYQIGEDLKERVSRETESTIPWFISRHRSSREP